MKKKIGINILLIILTNLSVVILSLILPFFFQWYESKLGESNVGAEILILTIGLVTWLASNIINGVIINNKIENNKILRE